MFDATERLRNAVARAKSDVANKLVAMVLHEVSARVASPGEVRSVEYRSAVRATFQNRCPYCGEALNVHNTVIEHLDAMNQTRAGLQVPGNVLPACRPCNLEKRRDDQAQLPPLGDSGWDSFLRHDGTRCVPGCKTCDYFASKEPDLVRRRKLLHDNLNRIAQFREQYLPEVVKRVSSLLSEPLQRLYTHTQDMAVLETERFIQLVFDPERSA